jgi:hypothetical protein
MCYIYRTARRCKRRRQARPPLGPIALRKNYDISETWMSRIKVVSNSLAGVTDTDIAARIDSAALLAIADEPRMIAPPSPGTRRRHAGVAQG